MPTLKEVQNKISGVKKTKQITKAMNMVAASRLRGAQTGMEEFRPYAGKFSEVLGSLAERAGEEAANPLLTQKEVVKKAHIVLCTSDRGLCGGFNVNLIKKAENFLEEKKAQGMEVSFTAFGKKGRDWLRKSKLQMEDEYLGIVGSSFAFSVASNAGNKLIRGFLDGTYDEVYIIYSEFLGMSKQVPVLKQLLPVPPIETEEEEVRSSYMPEHICEPSPDKLMGEMLPRNVYIQIHSALLETSTSEHAARMMAMENATSACNDVIDELTLIYNKARQASITSELMDIIGGAEALKG
jgi:F-type H+-transporting ATPase subunit gamma